jgi:hypothetical protein
MNEPRVIRQELALQDLAEQSETSERTALAQEAPSPQLLTEERRVVALLPDLLHGPLFRFQSGVHDSPTPG